MSKVSLIIVNYNQGEMLRNCIVSVAEHSADIPVEYIVVDNSDKLDVTPYLEDLSGVKLIKNEQNRGFAAANNQGLEVAQGDYFVFLNNDTLFVENTLGKIIQFYESLTEPALIGCKLLNADGSHQFSVVDFDSLSNQFGEYFFLSHIFKKSASLNKFHHNFKIPDEISEVDVVKGAFIFGKTADVKKHKGFDEDFFFFNEENDLCWRFKQNGGKVWYYPKAEIIHLGGATTVSMKWFSIKHQALSKMVYFRKNSRGVRRILFFVLHYLGYLIRVPVYLAAGMLSFNRNLMFKAFYYFKSIFQIPRINQKQ
jgi:GT2 family glycosyltransferase